MKKSILILVLLAILSGSAATAQQKPHTSYLLLTVYDESNGLFRSTEKIVVSHPDGTQESSQHSMRAYMYTAGRFAEEEDSILPRLQPYFDSGFPYGQDQWISAAGTAWATMALSVTVEAPRVSRK